MDMPQNQHDLVDQKSKSSRFIWCCNQIPPALCCPLPLLCWWLALCFTPETLCRDVIPLLGAARNACWCHWVPWREKGRCEVANASQPTQMFTHFSVHWEAGWKVLTLPLLLPTVQKGFPSLFPSFSFPVFLPVNSMTCCISREYKAGKTQQGWNYGNFHAGEMSHSKCDGNKCHGKGTTDEEFWRWKRVRIGTQWDFCLVVEISLIKLLFSSRAFSHQDKEPRLGLTLWLKLWR